MDRVTPKGLSALTLSYLATCLTVFLSSCAFAPSFSPSPPDLLIEQDPPKPPLFVTHPPTASTDILWFTGHVRKSGTLVKARKAALSQAFGKFSDFLSRKGYPLTDQEKRRWFRLGDSRAHPSIADRWIRTYKESQDRPYLHRISYYALLAIPVTYEQTILASLARRDRGAGERMEAMQKRARQALRNGDGAGFLSALREALKAERAIHTLRSFPEGVRRRILLERTAVESRWRKSLRGLRLSVTPPSRDFPLKETLNPPARLAEETFLRPNGVSIGLSGLLFDPSLHPFKAPEHLVFPGLSWLFGNRRPVFSRETLDWEIALFSHPLSPGLPPLTMTCTPTGSTGKGNCDISKIHVPGDHGYIEGYYRPVPHSPLDRSVFRTIFEKTLLEVHFRFYHRRALHPIILSLAGTRPFPQMSQILSIFMEEGRSRDLTFCPPGPDPSCPGGPPPALLDRRRASLKIEILSDRTSTINRGDFSIVTKHLHLRVTLSDQNGVFWRTETRITSRDFSKENATLSTWKACARRLTRDLARVYYPPRHPHPGETLHDT